MLVSKPPTSGNGEIDPKSHSLLAVQSMYSLTAKDCEEKGFFLKKRITGEFTCGSRQR